MSSPLGTWPPLPPQPPEPVPQHTPWLPGPRPIAPGPVSASASLVVGADWLAGRLLDHRVVTLSGRLDAESTNRAIAELALLDASGDDPVQVRMSGAAADLDATLALIDAVDLMGCPVHVTALGTVESGAVAVVAVGDRRTAGPHAAFRLCEPGPPRDVPRREVEAWAAAHAQALRRVQERIAEACGRPADDIADDMKSGRVLSAAEAVDYGLVDSADVSRRSR
jgi:ATP-dependent Clp protease, protease subunit